MTENNTPKVKYSILYLIFIGFIFSCSDDEPVPAVISAMDLIASVQEYPEVGFEIGIISATTDKGILSFEITTQSVAGALAVDAASGKIIVADASKFVYDLNPKLTAEVKIKNIGAESNVKVEVNLKKTEIDLVGKVNNIQWIMKFGRTLGPEFISYSPDNYNIVFYSTDWTDVTDPCTLNSVRYGFIHFVIPRELGEYSFTLTSKWSPGPNEIVFGVREPRDDDVLNILTLQSGTVGVNINSISDTEITGNLSGKGSNGELAGNFVINICE